jgi:CHAT domain-containing protein/tetratricopeptide (TPR) repeat protein
MNLTFRMLVLLALLCGYSLADQPKLSRYRDAMLSDLKRAEEFRKQGKFAEAIRVYRKMTALAERLSRKLDAARCLFPLAELHEKLNELDQARSAYERCIKILEGMQGKNDLELARALTNLASVYQQLGEAGRAEEYFQRGLRMRQAKLGPDHWEVAHSLNYLGLLYYSKGRYAQAEALLRRALKIYEAHFRKDHWRLGPVLNNLGLVCMARGQYAQAMAFFRRSLDIVEAMDGKDHRNAAQILHNMGGMCQEQGKYVLAERLYYRCLIIWEKEVGKDHPEVGKTLADLASAWGSQGKLTQAEKLLRRALKIFEASGKEPMRVANTLNNLGWIRYCQGEFVRAAQLFQRSLKLFEKVLAPGHPFIINGHNNLAACCAAQGRWGPSVLAADRAYRLLCRHAHGILPFLDEPEQLAYLYTKHRPLFWTGLCISWPGRGEAGTTDRSASWVLNSKAVAQQVLAERSLLARDSRYPRRQKTARELTRIRGQLARLTYAPLPPGKEGEHRKRLAQLTRREQELSRQLNEAVGRLARDDPWVELAEVRKAVPPSAVLIEIAYHKVYDFKTPGVKPAQPAGRYLAWVIPPSGAGKVQMVNLGDAGPIEAAVRAAREAFQPDLKIVSRDEPGSEKKLRAALAPLAKLIRQPLSRYIDRADHWIISPDAALWLVPWAALPLADGRYAIEKHAVSYVVSGRDLIDRPDKRRGRGALVLADPDFDLKPGSKVTGAEAAVPARSALPRQALPRFERLPGTAAEARAITSLLERYAQENPAVRTGKDALESTFKDLRGPKVVVLCTHGYLLEDQNEAAVAGLGAGARGLKLAVVDQPRPKGEKVRVLENPLLRCGLALAGANQRDKAPEGTDDGILTGLEIVGTDLRGTELVVLSACETGLGQVRNGEGVAGLRQAFQLAGAQAVVATLWQIPDRETAALMTAFFENLAKKSGKAEALRRAQLKIIKDRRAKHKAAHPFYWAAFTLTGQWR